MSYHHVARMALAQVVHALGQPVRTRADRAAFTSRNTTMFDRLIAINRWPRDFLQYMPSADLAYLCETLAGNAIHPSLIPTLVSEYLAKR